ncbi:hypothetical protein CIG75_13555 [Tumebacillus algifaecis]|uniref:N-acetyltransferase domain-containing protein n=1 Tax=Tumebacillus algifaecis TaxID=1214604 RepID=A0A223D2H2_9BACL|nr:GNAT family N-acetyltransferase [Tumebacillus algifaecis]ASS75879.1 hypothetical protein CIG75_13555 [Tumebacillus algifaecis]
MHLEVRQIAEHEWETFCYIRAESYHMLSPEQALKNRHLTDLHETRCVFVNDEMKATGRLFPFTQYLHGQALSMGGVASVATRIEERGQGYVRELLSAMLQEMKDNAVPVSCLHPSMYEFYRKFGYAFCCEKRLFKSPFQPKIFAKPATSDSGRIVRCNEAELATVKNLYDRYARTQNGFLRRRDLEWSKIVDNPFGGSKPRLYLWQDAQEEAQGYIVLIQQEDNKLDVKELIALTVDAQKGLLSLLEKDNLLTGWEWETHIDSILPSLLHDPKKMTSESVNWFMARIVDVRTAWQVTSSQAQAGTARLQVHDPFAPWNEGTWQLTVASSGTASVSATDELADASADIGTWTQIFYGYLSVEQALFLGKLTIHDPHVLPFLHKLWASVHQPLMHDYF